MPVKLFGEQFLLRVKRLLPGNLLARVSRHTTHHRQKCARRHALAVVDWLAFSNRGEQQVVFALIHVILLTGPSPGVLAFYPRYGTAPDRKRSIRTRDVIGVL